MKKTKSTLWLLISSLIILSSCAGAPGAEPVQIPIPARPMISLGYQEMLIKAGPELTQEGLKHEVEWHGYADKMEKRVK